MSAAATSVRIYSTSWCQFCQRAIALLDYKDSSYENIDIETQPGKRQEMIERTRQTSVPQIYIGTQHIGGWDELYALEQTGELDTLLQQG